MHEMSIAMSLLEMAESEARKNGCNRILRLRVEYGPLSGIMPEALQLAFAMLIKATIHEGALLQLVELPLKMRCPLCGAIFGGASRADLLEPCPACGKEFGHELMQGKELILAQLEAIAC